MLAQSFNPDTEDEDESEPIRGKFLFRLTLKVRKKLFVSTFKVSEFR